MPNAIPISQKFYQVGALRYTTMGLVMLFVWMLWGDFCWTLMEAVVPSVLPLKLKNLGGSNLMMALVMTTLPGILNSTVCPWVSFRSDRYRSRWGRRIPFILWTAPFLTAFLILLGYSDSIGHWVHMAFFATGGTFSATSITIGLIGFLMVGFQFFNMFVSSVYWYLFNDVVPEQFLGRFFGLFRMVGGLAGTLYNFYIFPHAETHMKEIFLGAALLYFFGLGMMCLMVKEGQYPPPPENLGGKCGFWAGVKTFIVECYSLRYYWWIFLTAAFLAMTGCVGSFGVFFSMDIGLNLTQIGQIRGYVGIIGIILTYPAGIIADRVHPIRVFFISLIAVACFTPINLIYLFFDFSARTVFHLSMATALISLPIGLINGAAELPMLMRILPKERYGQFCSARALVSSIGTIMGGLLAGGLLDLLKHFYRGSDFCYRFLPFWNWGCQIAALVCMLLLYRGWKKHGGSDNYIPPNVSTKGNE